MFLQSLDCGRLPAGKTKRMCVYVCAGNAFIPAVNLLIDYIPSSKSHKTEQSGDKVGEK